MRTRRSASLKPLHAAAAVLSWIGPGESRLGGREVIRDALSLRPVERWCKSGFHEWTRVGMMCVCVCVLVHVCVCGIHKLLFMILARVTGIDKG